MKHRLSILLVWVTIISPAFSKVHGLIVHPRYEKTKGFAIGIADDTLSGYFFVDFPKGLIFKRSPGKSGIADRDTLLPKSDFKAVFLEPASRSTGDNAPLIEYVYIPEYKNFLRKIYSGKADYYDENLNPQHPEKVLGDIRIIQKNGVDSVTISYSSGKEMFARPLKLLVDYLNKISGSHYTVRDFTNVRQVIHAIEEHLPEKSR